MTAPNTQTSSLARNAFDFNPDGALQFSRITAMGAANVTANAAVLVNGILTFTQSANITVTTDTGANISAQLGNPPVGACFDVILTANNAANTAVTLAGGTGVTIAGATSVTAANAAGRWRFITTAANTWTAYGT